MKKTIRNIFAALIAFIDSAILRPVPQDFWEPKRKASVKFSALMTGIKGKVGGSVFQYGKTGFILRNKPSGNFVKAINWVFGRSYTQVAWSLDYATLLDLSPGQLANDGSNTNLSTPYTAQQLIRQLSKAWGSLEPSDREAWSAAAPSFPFLNKWGEQYTGSGFQLFVSINSKLMPYEVALQTLPPSASDGTLPDWPWSTIFLEPESSATKFLQLEVPDGIADGAALIVSLSPAQSSGRTYRLRNCRAQIRIQGENPSTFELLPIYEMLFGSAFIESVINVKAEVINLSNGHVLYSSDFQQLIRSVLGSALAQFSQQNNYSPPPALSLAESIDWGPSPSPIDLGSLDVDDEGDTLGYLFRIIQLTPSEAITFTVSGAQSIYFSFYLDGNEIVAASPLTTNANSVGTFGNKPLGFSFHPSILGALTATLTITAASLPAPIVITVNGIGT